MKRTVLLAFLAMVLSAPNPSSSPIGRSRSRRERGSSSTRSFQTKSGWRRSPSSVISFLAPETDERVVARYRLIYPFE